MKDNKFTSGKIGIFDSGFGGLSILKAIVKKLPKYDYVYLGDGARAPYGDRSQKEIFKFTKEGIDFLFTEGAELVILACNSASSEALRKIQKEYLKAERKDKRVLGVLVPAVEDAIDTAKGSRIAIIGTRATVKSGAFRREILKRDSDAKVFEIATPLLAPLVEAGEDKGAKAKKIIEGYMQKVKDVSPDALILGCTHYEILQKEIERHTKNIKIISEGLVVANKLENYLKRHKEIDAKLSKKKERAFFTTSGTQSFDRLGSRFLGRKIRSKKVSL